MPIQAKRINNVKVDPLVLPKQPKHILGCKLFSQLNANIFIAAPKNSGKTTVIKKILDECADKNTHVIIFCGTIHNDPTWKAIIDDLDHRHIKHSDFTSIFTDNGVNILDALIKELTSPEEEKQAPAVKIPIMKFAEDDKPDTETKEKKKKKKKYQSPDYIIIFDDLSAELKNPMIPKLMKIQRHFSSKIIISSQSYIDCDPRVRNGNLDYLLLFRNIPDHVLDRIYEEQSIPMNIEMFKKLYYH